MKLPVLSLSLAFAMSAGASASVTISGISFLDRVGRGEITLGTVRGSIGVIDYDNDGWYDLFIADNPGSPNRLFRNIASPTAPGGRAFVDVSAATGLADDDGTARGFGGVVVFDYDNDGFSDIYTLGNHSNGTSGLLYRNKGDGTFANTSIAAGVRLTGYSQTSASATDFDHDGFADLLVVSTGNPARTLALLRNNGDGTFTRRSDLVPPVTFSGITYCHAWNDFDHDGWEDGLICFGVPMTLKNVPDGSGIPGRRRLIDASATSGFNFLGPAPMGIAVGDHNGDGWMDLAITDAISGTYYENRAGTFVQTFPYTTFFGWGSTFLDAENDGDLDNYQAGSYSSSNIDYVARNNSDGTWTDVRAALNTTSLPSQQCARIDFDNDGREDIITINPGRFVSIYHNQSTSGNHWSTVRLIGYSESNRSAIGAVVRLKAGNKTQVREVVAGSSYSATEDPRLHFGLGSVNAIDQIEVVWPRRGTIAQRTQVFTGPFTVDSVLSLASNMSCPADLNADRVVDDLDFVAFAFGYDILLCTDSSQPVECPADLNTDGFVNDEDFVRFAAAYDDLICP